MGRILAIDYGLKRVGIAVTDEQCIIANALTTVHSNEALSFLKEYCASNHVDLFIIGDPRRMNNEASELVKYIEPFINKLKAAIPNIPIIKVDERFTSKMAFSTMIESGINKKSRQNKALVDTLSATILLQSFMESRDYQNIKNSQK